MRNFRQARFLEPDYAGLPFDEGTYWLGVAPSFAIEPWAEALRRVPADRRAEMYRNMLADAFAGHPELHPELWSLAGADAAMELVYFGWAAPEEFKPAIEEILHEDPALARFSPGQLQRLFAIWLEKGDAQRLAFLMARRPDWLKAGYRTLARYDAARGDFAGAVDLMERNYAPPRLPRAAAMTHAEAAGRFAEDPGDVAAGLALYAEAVAAGRDFEALDTLREISGGPGYVHYLEGQLLVKQGRLAEAWKALDQCPP